MAKIFEMRGEFDAYYADEHHENFRGSRSGVLAEYPQETGTSGTFDSANITFDHTTATKFIAWTGGDNWPSNNLLSIRWRIEPNWTGQPPLRQSLFEVGGALDSFRTSGFDFTLQTTTSIFTIYDGDFSGDTITTSGLTFTSGQITDIMFTYNGDTGEYRISQDGVEVATGTGFTFSVDRNNRNVSFMGIGRGIYAGYPEDYKLYNLEIWDSIESHTYTARTDYETLTTKQPNNWTSLPAADIEDGINQIQAGVTQTGSFTGNWTSLTAGQIRNGVEQIQAGLTQTGTFAGEVWSTIGADDIRNGTNQIQNGVTITGTLNVPNFVDGTTTVINIPNIKEQIRYVLNENNTTTASVLDLSAGMSTRVQRVAKLNPEKLPIQPSQYPAVTVFTDRKGIEERDIAKDQINGKRRGRINFKIVGIVFNTDYQTDLFNDPADDDLEKLMENTERILRAYHDLGDTVKWQFPNDVTYHTATFDEETHMRVGLLDLEATLIY